MYWPSRRKAQKLVSSVIILHISSHCVLQRAPTQQADTQVTMASSQPSAAPVPLQQPYYVLLTFLEITEYHHILEQFVLLTSR